MRLKDRGSYRYLHTLRELFGLDPAPADEAPAAEVTRLDRAARRRRGGCLTLRIGTRGSALALAQARWVAERLDDDTELVPITTSGDRGSADDKSRFVKEIEEALLAGEVDLAVHSAKDVPGELPEGLAIVGRARAGRPARRALRRRLARRAAPRARWWAPPASGGAPQLLALRPDLEVRELRGNVDTRLRRLASGDFDAIVLARGRPGATRARRRGRAAARAGARARAGLPGAGGAQPTTSAPPRRPPASPTAARSPS